MNCPKCSNEMIKGVFLPSVGVIGMEWTEKKEWSNWKIEKITKIKTFQYACQSCGYIESYLDLNKEQK
jgi:hypothetical protein